MIFGWCAFHKIDVTKGVMKKHRCLQKHCTALVKKDCEFWRQRERKMQIKRIKKKAGIPPWQKVNIRTDRHGNIILKPLKPPRSRK